MLCRKKTLQMFGIALLGETLDVSSSRFVSFWSDTCSMSVSNETFPSLQVLFRTFRSHTCTFTLANREFVSSLPELLEQFSTKKTGGSCCKLVAVSLLNWSQHWNNDGSVYDSLSLTSLIQHGRWRSTSSTIEGKQEVYLKMRNAATHLNLLQKKNKAGKNNAWLHLSHNIFAPRWP